MDTKVKVTVKVDSVARFTHRSPTMTTGVLATVLQIAGVTDDMVTASSVCTFNSTDAEPAAVVTFRVPVETFEEVVHSSAVWACQTKQVNMDSTS